MTAWPSDVPEYPLKDSFVESPPDVVIRTSVGVGPDKVRRRFTAAPIPMQMTFLFTKAQLTSFNTFFDTTCKGGSLTFTRHHPRTKVNGTFRFLSRPKYRSKDPDTYYVQVAMEELP